MSLAAIAAGADGLLISSPFRKNMRWFPVADSAKIFTDDRTIERVAQTVGGPCKPLCKMLYIRAGLMGSMGIAWETMLLRSAGATLMHWLWKKLWKGCCR